MLYINTYIISNNILSIMAATSPGTVKEKDEDTQLLIWTAYTVLTIILIIVNFDIQ